MKPANRLVWILGAIVTLVATLALRNAVAWYGHVVPGVLVDAGGSVSNFGPPTWEGKRLGLQFPDGLVPKGQDPGSGSRARTRAWDDAVLEAAPRGYLEAIVEAPGGRRTVVLPVRPIEPLTWWVYAGSGLIAGVLYAGAGLLALWVNPKGPLARTFAIFGVNTGLFWFCVFDIHTQRSLALVFFVSFVFVPITMVLMMLRLPDDAALLKRHPVIEPLAYLLALGLGTAASIVYATGGDTRGFQSLFTLMISVGILTFVVGFAVRYFKASAARRQMLRPLLVSMVPVYGVLGLTLFSVLALGQVGVLKVPADVVAYPAMILAPLASLYAFVKHDFWGSRALLSRVATHVALGVIACIVAIATGAALSASIGLSFRDALTGGALSAVLVVTLSAVARKISDSTLFHSRADYKPTIEQLSAELLMITSQAEVARAVERTVARWLPCEFVSLTLDENANVLRPELPSRAASDAEPARKSEAEVRLPVTFAGRPLAWLDVGAKRGGALFTVDDVDLLRTIANQGALALAHAQAYQELEERRRQQAQAFRGEREALVETVAAEIAHEIRYPINYFRNVFQRSAGGERLDAEDIEVGREEVDRLERLVSGLRRMATNRLTRVPASVLDLCTRAEALLTDALAGRRLELDVAEDAVVRCDPDKMLQVVVNLLSNALEAIGATGRVGVRFETREQVSDLVVWDDGPGFTGDPVKLFAPWFTTKPRGTGLGLAITHRLVRAHGWNIVAERREERTLFVISVRKEDILLSGSTSQLDSEPEAEVA